jgi:uncharacterized protein YndB with AHSA1/START domain
MSDPATAHPQEIRLSRTFDAPREMVFKAITEPDQVVKWWGPRGFTTTTERMEVRPGGQWRFCMHGPDGRDYENLITYIEVKPPEKLVYKHGGEKDVEPVNFTTEITLEDLGGGKTKVTWLAIFPSQKARDYVVETRTSPGWVNSSPGSAASLSSRGNWTRRATWCSRPGRRPSGSSSGGGRRASRWCTSPTT